MPDASRIVINTGPILALIAAQGDLAILKSLYKMVSGLVTELLVLLFVSPVRVNKHRPTIAYPDQDPAASEIGKRHNPLGHWKKVWAGPSVHLRLSKQRYPFLQVYKK